MHCNGHCYLMKKLKQTQEKEKQNVLKEFPNNFQHIHRTNGR
jgi:hypothetical protein